MPTCICNNKHKKQPVHKKRWVATKTQELGQVFNYRVLSLEVERVYIKK